MKNSNIEPRFIAVEGAIGAGKTSLVNLLGENYGARLILEETESNPFISKFMKIKKHILFKPRFFFY